MLIDTHCHIYLEEFAQDREETLLRAIDADIQKIIFPNIDRSTIDPMLSFCDTHPDRCFPLMGLHPTSVDENYKQELDYIEQQFSQRKYYGIGEIGIDLYWDQSRKKEQIEVFHHQVKLAKALKLPIVIHSRNSYPEVLEVLEKEAGDVLFGIFHSFTGTSQEAHQIIQLGFKLGINGIVTFKNSGLTETLNEVPLENIVIETDSPYLTPVPHRGKRNEPSYVRFVAKKLSDIYHRPLSDIAAITTNNALRVFAIDQ
jgi:TatD DNase family protein